MRIGEPLNDYRRYQEQIDRLHLKYSRRNRLYELRQEGVSLASLTFNRGKLARLLARTVARGEYRLRPAQTRRVQVNGKERLLYQFCLTDLIVHGTVSSMINDAMGPRLSPHLYSYRKGTHWWQAVSDFAGYVRAHRKSLSDPRMRGLYVLRRDIHKYTDWIPVDDRSEVWPMLREILRVGERPRGRAQRQWEIVRNVVRPEVLTEVGFLSSNVRGVPTGSPISTTLFNLYLTPLDEELGSFPGAFYARYSDDLLFAHPDARVAQEADRVIDTTLKRLRLRTNEDKDQNFFFNGAGRPTREWKEARPAVAVAFLGCNVRFDAAVSLNRKKVRRLMNDLHDRARRTRRALEDRHLEQAGPIVCAAVNEALRPASSYRQKSAPMLRSAVTDRRQLRELDYRIARMVVRVLTGTAGVRAFRRISYRTLRRSWGLTSLLHARNRARGARRNGSCGR